MIILIGPKLRYLMNLKGRQIKIKLKILYREFQAHQNDLRNKLFLGPKNKQNMLLK